MPKLYDPTNLGKRVEVFLSLAKKYPLRWIVRTFNPAPSSKNRIVLNGGNEDEDKELTRIVGLRNCEFFVYEAKRQCCINLKQNGARKLPPGGKKDVFAWVTGDLVAPEDVEQFCDSEVTYHRSNPHFLDATGRAITAATAAFFTHRDGRFRVLAPRSDESSVPHRGRVTRKG